MDLLAGVQTSHVLLELHGVKGDEGAELAAELLLPRVAPPPVLQEHALVGAGEVALRAVVGQVRTPPVLLHVPLVGEDGVAGVMATLHRRHAVGLPGVTQQLLAQGTPEGAALLEARQGSRVRRDVVGLHVGLERPALLEGLAAGGARVGRYVGGRRVATVHVAAAVDPVDVGEVAAEGVALDGRIVAAAAAVDLLAGLAQQVHAQLALAGEEAVAGGALQAGAGEVEAQVLLEVGAHLEAAAAFGARVRAEDVL